MEKTTSNPTITTTSSETSSLWSSETIKATKTVSSSNQLPYTITEGLLSVTPFPLKPSAATGGQILSVGELSSSLKHFGWMDCFVFVTMLVVCAVIGLYFGFIEKKGKRKRREQRRGSEALDYLVGGRNMKVFPVALSLVASFVSGISLLGTSTEIYVYGTQYAFILITISLAAIISWYIFLPVFCNLQITSTYEYFEMRFDRRVQCFGAFLYIIRAVLWLPIAIYVPALTFNQVTGVNIHTITPIVCGICIFYTTVGGLKAVVFTDFLQSFIMFGTMFLIMVKGTWDLGGFGVVWQRNMDSGRIEIPELTFDPTVRMSMLSVLVGGTLLKLQSTAISQCAVQRFIALPSMKAIKQCLFYYCIGLTILLGSCIYVGLVIFATYHDCDPLTTKLVNARDQLAPLLVMNVLGSYPGMAGLFVSAVFSAALSAMSTMLNSLSAVVLEDFAKPFSRHSLTERQTAIVMRAVVVVFGTTSIGLVYVVEKLGMVLQLAATMQSISQGPMMGVFIVGVCMPWVNSKSVLLGSVMGFITIAWIGINAQISAIMKEFVPPEKPVSVEGCMYKFDFIPKLNSTLADQPEPRLALYHMSWLLYSGLGALLTVIFSNLAIVICGRNKKEDIDTSLLTPFLRKYYIDKKYQDVEMMEKVNLDEKL